MLPVDSASSVKLGEGSRANVEQGRIQKIRGRKNRSKCVCPSVQDIWLSGQPPSLPTPSPKITTTISILPTVSLTGGRNNIKHGYAGFGGSTSTSTSTSGGSTATSTVASGFAALPTLNPQSHPGYARPLGNNVYQAAGYGSPYTPPGLAERMDSPSFANSPRPAQTMPDGRVLCDTSIPPPRPVQNNLPSPVYY